MITTILAAVFTLFVSQPLLADEGTCYPVNTPCPSGYGSCLRVRLVYNNKTGDSAYNTMDVDEVIAISAQFMPTIYRSFKKTLVDSGPMDCIIDSTALYNRTNLLTLSLKFNAPGYKADNCQITLSREQVVGNHSYTVYINRLGAHYISCEGEL